MLGESYFQLLSPLIFLIFSGGFLLLWRQARDIRSLPWFSVSYVFGAAAMFGDFFRTAMHPDFASGFLSALYLATTMTFCAALYAHYAGRVPARALVASAAGVFVLFAWLRFVVQDIVLCAWAINAGTVALYLYSIYDLNDRMTRRIDRVLQAVIGVSAALLIIRTGIVFWYEGSTMTATNYAGSLAAVTLQLFIAVAALAVAGVLFVMYGMDIIRRLTVTGETDPLTGALNRRGFEAHLPEISADGVARNAVHAVVIADIDRFKAVNDVHGHDAGDTVITAFAELLREAAREDDMVVRWGGEEFLVLIANAEIPAARLYAEAVRLRWQSTAHESLGGDTVTASFGIARWNGGADIALAIGEADQALYRAKQQGRNKVLVHDGKRAAELAGRRAVA